MLDYLTMTTARVRRLNGREDPAQLRDLAQVSPDVAAYLAIESGAAKETDAYALLGAGELDRLFARAKSMGEDGHRLLRLAAISEGASRELADAALALPLKTENQEANLWMYAVAARHGRDTTLYGLALERTFQGAGAEGVLEFLEALRRGDDPESARALLPPIALSSHLAMLNAGVIILGPRAPAAWKNEVRRGLFVGERGYFAAPAAG
jgi:hypothetical protein